MADTKYTYSGPVSGVTLKLGEGTDAPERDVQFSDGCVVELPADHPYVQCMVAQGRLVVVPATAKDPKPNTGDNKKPSKEPV